LDFFATLPPCLVGIEGCPTAHYWSRQLGALGHTVRLLLFLSSNDAAFVTGATLTVDGGLLLG
jgi:transposase